MGPPTCVETYDGEATLVEGPNTSGRASERDGEVSSSDETPRFLGRYMVIDELGKGGMGTVYRAYDPQLDREVALKMLRRVTDDARARLVREAQAMGLLSHPNVLPVYDVASEGHRLFIAMELVRGRSLRQWLDERPRTWSEVLAVFMAAGQGLHAAHAAGLVHRDFKPGNVLIGDDGRVRVMDFGLARGTAAAGARSSRESLSALIATRVSSSDGELPALVARRETPSQESVELSAVARWVERSAGLDPEQRRASDTLDLLTSLSEDLTQFGTVIGTPAYMAPEQHLGRGADVRSDQYGFCVALWEALYGVRPFEARPGGDWYRAKTARPPKLDATRWVPRWLHAVVARGLSPRPSQRYESMPALLHALARGQRRRRHLVVALGGSLALGATALAVGAGDARPSPCAGAQDKLAGVWDQSQRARLEQAILAAETPLAADTWTRLAPRLTDYADRWQAARQDACEATLVRHEQPEALMDARMRCLDERRQGLEALVDTLAVADAGAVERAVAAVSELPRVEACADPEYLQALAPRPGDPEVAAEVDALEQTLADLKAQARAGRSAQVLPQARAALDRARTLGHPPIEVAVLLRVADLSSDVGRYDDAEALYEQAYFMAQHEGLDTPRAQAAIALINLLGSRLGRPQDGVRWERFARAALVAVHDPGVTASYLNNAGLLAKERSDYATAVELLEQALAERERLHGSEHPQVAAVLNNLAIAHQDQGHLDQALALHQRALAMREQLLGPEHPDVATSLLNVSNIHKDLAHYDLAIEQLERAHAIYARAYGPEHPHAAGCLVNLGAIHEELGQHERALERYRSALVVLERAQGEHHPNVAGTVANIGNVYRARGELERAMEHYERALASIEKTLGPDDAMVTIVLINMGLVALDRQDHETAEAHLRRALEITGKTLGLEHPKVAAIYINLAQVHAARDEHDEALRLEQQAVQLRRRVLGALHPDTALASLAVGRTQLARGEPQDAIEPLEHAIGALVDHPDQAAAWNEARFELARAWWQTGRRGEARRLAQQARAGLVALADEQHAERLAEIDGWLREHRAG